MNIKIFFGLYADRSEESFHKAFLTLLRESKDIADLRGIVRGVSEFPELLKGKERDFIFASHLSENGKVFRDQGYSDQQSSERRSEKILFH